MSSTSLSAILGHAGGHDALIELLELDEDVKGLKGWLVKIGNSVADQPIDEAVRMIGRAVVITNRLDAAYYSVRAQ